MKCPDCGRKMTELPVEGYAVHRCLRCGGFWVDSGVVKMITAEQLGRWKRVSAMSPMRSGSGQEVCPADGTKLKRYRGDPVPANLTVKRCDRCGKWWFPEDALFAYIPISGTNASHSVQRWMWLLLAVFLVVAVTSWSVRMVLQEQQKSIAASVKMSELAITYTGYGEGLVVFKVDKPVREVGYQMGGSLIWQKAPVEDINGYDVARLKGLVEGGHYIINVLGKENGFIAK